MLDRIVGLVANHAGRERSRTAKLASLLLGFLTFFALVPCALGAASRAIARHIPPLIPTPLEMPVGTAAMALGLTLLAWSVWVFWSRGRGTPVPFASPTRLVTTGPFRYTRNPIKLGALLFYLGSGTVWGGLSTGLLMFAMGLALGTAYHKLVEERELVIRFGGEYEEYRRRTPFLIPWPPKREKALPGRAKASAPGGSEA